MKVKNQALWEEQLTELEQDEPSRKFKQFLLTWGNAADKIIDEEDSDLGFQELGWGDDDSVIAAVVSNALAVTEQTLGGFLSIEWIGQMLLLLTEHWEHGDELLRGLSFIESRLVSQATAMKLLDLQENAKTGASIATE